MSECSTTGQKQYEQILLNLTPYKLQHSGREGSSDASYLIGFTEFEYLFLVFGNTWFCCLETKQIVRHRCLGLQNLSFSSNDWVSLKTLSFRSHFLAIITASIVGEIWLLTKIWNNDWLFHYTAHMSHSFTVPSQDETDLGLGLPCLFLNIAQLAF